MAWRIEYTSVAVKNLSNLDPQAAKRILRFIDERILPSSDPRSLGEALHGVLGDLWKYRVGSHRIIARIEDRRLVILILRIGARRDVYRL